MGVKNFCTKLPKGTALRQIWSNKSFGVCGSDVILTPDEKKKQVRIAIGNSMSSITLRRYRDVVMQLFLLSTAGTGDIYVKHSFISVSYTHLTLPTNREV